jgi:uncharacterized protein YeeX (DUF496 family)
MSGTYKDKKIQHVQGLRRSGASGTHKNKVRDRQKRISHATIWKDYIKENENE